MRSGFAGRHIGTAVAITGLFALAGQLSAADLSLPVTGNLLGSVVDASGTPQMGATVRLFNKYQRLIAKTLSAPDGRFAFTALPADSYSVRVSLSSFLPAARDKVPVKAGMDSMLAIHLATLFSNIEVSYSLPSGAMSDDWKWVLRSSSATRPITRYLPVELSGAETGPLHPHIFSGTHAVLSISGGDAGPIDSDSSASDLGTGFALSTSVFGNNQVRIAGRYGENGMPGPPAFNLCAMYTRSEQAAFGAAPEITVTVSQLALFGPQSAQFGNGDNGSPLAIRTMSMSMYETADPLDNVHLEYGATGESIDYLQHTSRLTPFARLTVGLGRAGQIVAAYSNGARPDELLAHQQYDANALDAKTEELAPVIDSLTRLPEVSERGGRLEVERTQEYEIGYNKTAGSRTYAASAFYENVSNGRMNLAGDLSPLDANDLLGDGISETSTYNIGRYRRTGYIASVDQRVTDSLKLAVVYGRMGGFAGSDEGLWDSSGIQQQFLQQRMDNVASVNVKARAPVSGTQFIANYGWADNNTVVPWHAFTTQNTYLARGLNVLIRQPLPSFFGIPGRLELTADLRNLLAQGYVPLPTSNGNTLLVVQAPRCLRGGLNFIF